MYGWFVVTEAVFEQMLLDKAELFALTSDGKLMTRVGAFGLGREQEKAARERSAAIDWGQTGTSRGSVGPGGGPEPRLVRYWRTIDRPGQAGKSPPTFTHYFQLF